MRKHLAFALCLSLLLSLPGCGAGPQTPPETAPAPTETAAPATVATDPPTETTLPPHDTELYELDTSEYHFTFGKVLLRFDWTDMTFALKCFDGSVITGILERRGDSILCIHEGGRMILSSYFHEGKQVLGNTNHVWDEDRYYTVDQRMICPPVDYGTDYRFVLAEDQNQEITAGEEVLSLEGYKYVYSEMFSFQAYAPGKDDPDQYDPCALYIYHYPLAEKWVFQHYTRAIGGSVEVDGAEDPDGRIVFTRDGKQWNFHREGDSLIFDGGSTLVIGNGVSVAGRPYVEMELPVGTEFRTHGENYIYDGLYILPANSLEDCYAAIRLDIPNQRLTIRCWDGNILSGPFTYGDEYSDNIAFACEYPDYVGTRKSIIYLIPYGHGLNVGNQWMLSIGPEGMTQSNRFTFVPVEGGPLQEPEAQG